MSLDGTLTSIVTFQIASEPSGEESKRLVFAMWKVIKPFKKQIRRLTSNIASSVLYCIIISQCTFFDTLVVFYIDQF